MSDQKKFKLVAPTCRYCGREWTPARHVSAEKAFCQTCLPERVANVRHRTSRLEIVIGLDGSQVVVPIRN
jgi:hypothetical protein